MVKKITALKIQKRNKNRVSVYLDGEYTFGLTKIVAGWLKVGQELTDEKIAELKEKDNTEIALQKALNFLSYRPRSEDEVRKNLKKHGYEEEVIEVILERLRQGHLVDDASFAEMWVENRSEFRPRGRRLLRMELRKKGINDEVIDPSLEDLDEEELAYRAASKQIRKYRNLEWPDYRKKMSGFLARRGFDYGIISIIIKKVWEENSP
jgi:regulatory protein